MASTPICITASLRVELCLRRQCRGLIYHTWGGGATCRDEQPFVPLSTGHDQVGPNGLVGLSDGQSVGAHCLGLYSSTRMDMEEKAWRLKPIWNWTISLSP